MSTPGDKAGDEVLSMLLQENADLEERLEHFHLVGRLIGSVYTGIAREGVSDHDALELTSNWMECHLFDRIEKYAAGGGLVIETADDDDEDAVDPEDFA